MITVKLQETVVVLLVLLKVDLLAMELNRQLVFLLVGQDLLILLKLVTMVLTTAKDVPLVV